MVMASTDTVICLNGHVCCTGSPSAVFKSQEYLQLFGTRAAATLALYEHHHDHMHLPDGRVLEADGSVVEAHEHQHHDDEHHDHAQ
jgi:zinc transport system ATP-binding protein